MKLHSQCDNPTVCENTNEIPRLRFDFTPTLTDTEMTNECGICDKGGHLLLNLYQLAMSSSVEEFETQIFLLLKEYFIFDSAWLGKSTNFLEDITTHNSYLYNLPKEFVAEWEQVKTADFVAVQSARIAKSPIALSLADEGFDEPYRRLLGKYAIAQLLVAVSEDPLLRLWTHLSLYRNSLLPAFSDAEIELIKFTMPHLASALNLNRVHYMQQLKTAKYPPNTSFAISDNLGTIQYADTSFGNLMLMEWPEWNRATLPRVFQNWQQEKSSKQYVGKMITLQAEEISDLLFIIARPRSSIDSLTRRELAVIRIYAQGMTYKEVAKTLAISPTTVRYYLREAYNKLKIQHKSEIAWLLGRANSDYDSNE